MRHWVISGLLFFFAAACRSPCDGSTCAGCCDVSGECISPTRSFCGRNGTVCQQCRSDEFCRGGQCVAPVDAGVPDAGPADFCRGGCRSADGTCGPGNLPEACGGDGGLCLACAPSDRCESGRCISLPCRGCLDGLGRCQGGTTSSACGGAGSVCQACRPLESCADGGCVATGCGPATCGTCCQSGLCVSAPSASSCGRGGGTCVNCGMRQCASNGMCQ